jgi:hypothetical protein
MDAVWDMFDHSGTAASLTPLQDGSWELAIEDPFNTSTINLTRKHMKDLIEALENERYPSDGKSGE